MGLRMCMIEVCIGALVNRHLRCTSLCYWVPFTKELTQIFYVIQLFRILLTLKQLIVSKTLKQLIVSKL